jgi:hypothetical protein
MINKVYIIGEIPNTITVICINKFKMAQFFLEAIGFEVINPLEFIENDAFLVDESFRLNLKSLLDCDAVYVLPCVSLIECKNVELLLVLKLNIFIFQ